MGKRKRKNSTRQPVIIESLSIQEGLGQSRRENEIQEAQDTIPISPALSAAWLRVQAHIRPCLMDTVLARPITS